MMKKKAGFGIYEICIFAMLGALMFCSKKLMELLPNIHLVGMLTIVFTLVYRLKALIPIYLYIFLDGLFWGFNLMWMPYLYIWTVLWGITMLLPKNMEKKYAVAVYPALCALHGLFFGILYSPAYAILFGLDFKQTLAWILSGLPWDAVHMLGNFTVGLLIYPMYKLLERVNKRSYRK